MKVDTSITEPNLQFYSISLEELEIPCVAEGVRIHKATMYDYLMSLVGKKPKISLSRHIVRGDDYFLAKSGRNIAALGRICYSDLEGMTLEENEAFLISFLTLPEYRGRGLYVSLIQEMLYTLKLDGIYKKCYIWANTNNPASYRGIEKAGFSRMEIYSRELPK